MNRRDFLKQFVAVAAASTPGCAALLRQSPDELPLQYAGLVVRQERPGIQIPSDFIGISLDPSLRRGPAFLNTDRDSLLALLRQLGPHGILRLGGNTCDRVQWSEQDPPPNQRFRTPEAVEQVAEFIRALGWKLMYGLNLGTGTVEAAASEASYVAQRVGADLLAFQIGNEPDLYSRNGIRPADWGTHHYLKEWDKFAGALEQAVPDIPLAGPDAAYQTNWPATLARGKDRQLKLLTHHYYPLGPPEDPKVTIKQLFKSHSKLDILLEKLKALSEKTQRPYRLTETNSCYSNGKPGVSDTFASALWGLDLMYRAASKGCSGVNFHTGTQAPYTPIAYDEGIGWQPRPLFHAMRLFGRGGRGHLLPTEWSQPLPGLESWATKEVDGPLRVVLINANPAVRVQVTLDTGEAVNEARVVGISAPSLDTTQVTMLEGGEPGAGDPSARHQAKVEILNSKAIVELTAAAAILVELW